MYSQQPSKFRIPNSRRKSSVYKTHPKDCLFCKKKLSHNYYPQMIHKALYSKFSSSQNYYYTRDINDILASNRTKNVINYKDIQTFIDSEEEYLKRYYKISEHQFKMNMLSEYYKFHKDIARLFMSPICDSLNKYHDKRRRIDYFRIKKLLKEEGDSLNLEKTESDNSSTQNNKSKKPVFIGKVLDELDLTKKELETSNTLLELNKKLMEITENDGISSDFTLNNSQNFHDLSKFIQFMNKKTKPTGKEILLSQAKKLDLSKLKPDLQKSSRPLSGNKTPIFQKNDKEKKIFETKIKSQNLFLKEGSKTYRETLGSGRAIKPEPLKINSERITYEKILEKQKKNFVEIMNEAGKKMGREGVPTPNRGKTHTRVVSMALNNKETSIKNTSNKSNHDSLEKIALVTYNNFFKQRTNDIHTATLPKKNIAKTYHKYTKSDPNLLLPKMTPLQSNNINVDLGKKRSQNSINLQNNAKINGPFYTINQNNVLNIYFADDKTHGKPNLIKSKTVYKK